MNIPLLHKLIFTWFRKHGRVLPWRDRRDRDSESGQTQSKHISVRDSTIASYFTTTWNRNPYYVAVSELMLQQTQVDRVLPKFLSFIRHWPSVYDLASAKLSDVLVGWRGLGYNRRAKFLHEMARAVVAQHDGIFPQDEQELIKLPGVGKYTARAILAFAYGKDVGVIDTNIRRIFSRVFFGCEADSKKVSEKEHIALIDQSVPKGRGDPWNQALMDFGALVCTAKNPRCMTCPLQTICIANTNAQKSGHKNYAEFLKHANNATKKAGGVKKIPFEQTDRYFRGRIVEKLRNGPVHMEDLRVFMEKEYDLTDRLRWGTMIEKLVTDGLIQVKGSTISLP